MENSEEKKSEIEQAGEDLFNFVVDREDIKWLMSHLPEAADIQRETVEYELQILKIISVGWSISYYLETSPHKNQLLELYWKAVYDFSQTISTATGQFNRPGYRLFSDTQGPSGHVRGRPGPKS